MAASRRRLRTHRPSSGSTRGRTRTYSAAVITVGSGTYTTRTVHSPPATYTVVSEKLSCCCTPPPLPVGRCFNRVSARMAELSPTAAATPAPRAQCSSTSQCPEERLLAYSCSRGYPQGLQL